MKAQAGSGNRPANAVQRGVRRGMAGANKKTQKAAKGMKRK